MSAITWTPRCRPSRRTARVGALAYKWFGEDKTSFSKNINALEQAGQAAPRTLLIGVDADAFPMSYLDGETYSGFDVELAREVCSRPGLGGQVHLHQGRERLCGALQRQHRRRLGRPGAGARGRGLRGHVPYLTNDIVIVTLAQGGPKSLRGLKDGTLAMTVEQKYMDALASNEKLMERLGQIKRVSGGTQSLFDQLNSGAVNAIIVYSLALNYTG